MSRLMELSRAWRQAQEAVLQAEQRLRGAPALEAAHPLEEQLAQLRAQVAALLDELAAAARG